MSNLCGWGNDGAHSLSELEEGEVRKWFEETLATRWPHAWGLCACVSCKSVKNLFTQRLCCATIHNGTDNDWKRCRSPSHMQMLTIEYTKASMGVESWVIAISVIALAQFEWWLFHIALMAIGFSFLSMTCAHYVLTPWSNFIPVICYIHLLLQVEGVGHGARACAKLTIITRLS
jgi:hypothetical protein